MIYAKHAKAMASNMLQKNKKQKNGPTVMIYAKHANAMASNMLQKTINILCFFIYFFLEKNGPIIMIYANKMLKPWPATCCKKQ